MDTAEFESTFRQAFPGNDSDSFDWIIITNQPINPITDEEADLMDSEDDAELIDLTTEDLSMGDRSIQIIYLNQRPFYAFTCVLFGSSSENEQSRNHS